MDDNGVDPNSGEEDEGVLEKEACVSERCDVS